jgi:hypothetical protein
MRSNLTVGFSVLFCVVLSGCGAAEGESPEADVASDSDPETGTVQEAWGESTCGSATPVQTWSGTNTVTSSGPYGDAVCVGAFVGKGTIATNDAFTYFTRSDYKGPVPDGVTFPCNAATTQLSVWKRPAGSGQAYVKIYDGPIKSGALGGSSCVVPWDTFNLPSAANTDYKILGRAAFVGIQVPVQIRLSKKAF